MARVGPAILMTAGAVALTIGAAACGDEGSGAPAETLPPIATSTTTTTINTTTTTIQRYYEVQVGDTLFKIAERFGVSLDALIALNGITNPDKIEAGDQLEIPPATVVVDLPDPTTTTTGPSTVASP